MQFLRWLIFIFIGLWIVWAFTGGPGRNISQEGVYIKPVFSPETSWLAYDKNKFSLNIGQTGEEIQQEESLEKVQEIAGVSSYKDKITIRNGNAVSTDPNKEYLIIESSKDTQGKINITDWVLESSVTGNRIAIGKASYLPYTSTVNNEETVFLSPGGKALITTGRSPIGVSFRTNLCTGYFEQFQDFYPVLSRQCPRPEDEADFITTGPNKLNDKCIDYVESISKCTIVTNPLPIDMQYECSLYISSKINYNSCVENHKNTDSNFYGSEWRIFLNREDELWKSKRETIKLIDNNGNLVDTVTY